MEQHGQHKTESLTERPVANARERILEAAIHLFAKRGYASTYVREVVLRAGVTKPVLYYYFGSKKGLFLAILDWAAQQQDNLLDEAVLIEGPALERLEHLCKLFYKGMMEHQHLATMIHNLVLGPPQGAPPYDVDRYRRRFSETIREIYIDALKKGELRKADPEDVANLVLGLLEHSFHLDVIDPAMRDPQRPVRLLRLAFRGLQSGSRGISRGDGSK